MQYQHKLHYKMYDKAETLDHGFWVGLVHHSFTVFAFLGSINSLILIQHEREREMLGGELAMWTWLWGSCAIFSFGQQTPCHVWKLWFHFLKIILDGQSSFMPITKLCFTFFTVFGILFFVC